MSMGWPKKVDNASAKYYKKKRRYENPLIFATLWLAG